MLTHKHIDFLREIMTKEIRWRSESIEKFQPREGQTPEQAAAKLASWERGLAYAERVLEELDRLSERARTLAERENRV